MARKADPDLTRRRQKSGERLANAIKMKELHSKQFLSMIKEKYGDKDDSSEDGYYLPGLNSEAALSKIINGHSTLQNKHARMAAEILDIDVNYLLGTIDNFSEPSYDDYLRFKGGPGQVNKDWKKYDAILSIAGYKLVNIIYEDNEITNVIVSHGKQSVTIPIDGMEMFYRDVEQFIAKRFDPLMDLYRKDV